MLRSLGDVRDLVVLILSTALAGQGCKCSCSVEADGSAGSPSASASATAVAIPPPTGMASENGKGDRIVVSIRDESFVVKRDGVKVGQAASLEDLGRLLAARPSDEKSGLTIAASPATAYATILEVMDVARSSGFEQAHFKVHDD
jgi:biopolymer transport protein ExbD